ncbi:endonuclease III [Mycoplasmatota bacterium]|nr:endonuclease III [Mycoplasmatota bacterium]
MYNEIFKSLQIYEKEIVNNYNIFKGNLLEDEVKKFLITNPNAFLFGLISDQSIKAELAWSLPLRLKERIGYFNIKRIANEINEEEMETIIKKKPSLHRYPKNIAKYLIYASKILVYKYDGNASNIWKNTSAKELIMRLQEFKGISHKKASLGCLLLVRDFNLDLIDKENINIVYDIHIRRIFLRAGLCENDKIEDIYNAAKKIYPQFPGYLTSMFWAIGRDICRPKNPECNLCPIEKHCMKYTNINIK